MADYEKMYDLFALAMEMQASAEGLSLDDIMQKYKVSRRTAERMRDALLTCFPQMEEVKTGGHTKRWRITGRSLNSLISFSAEELAVFKTAIDSLKQSNLQEKAKTLSQVEQKLRNFLKPEQKNKIEVDADVLAKAEGLVLRPRPLIKIDKDILETLRQAILSCHHIKMVYEAKKNSGKPHIYQLVPYGFLYGQRNHYLVARHSDGYDNDKAHNFSLQCIKSVEILPAIFDSSEFDLNAYVEESFGAFHEEQFEVEWLFSANVADEAENFIFHPKQKLTRNPDGTLTVKFKAGGRREMDWFLYTWGDDVKVIKPKD